MQSLKDFLSLVAHRKAEYEQQQAGLASKMEKVKNVIESIKTRLELKFDEVTDQIEHIRREVFSKFDKKWEEVLNGVDDSARVLDERAELFDQLLSNMGQSRNGKQNDGESVLRFWLEAKTELESLETDSETKGEKSLQSFEKLSQTMSSRLDRAMEISAISVFQPLRSYFHEIVDGIQSSQPKNRRNSHKVNSNPQIGLIHQTLSPLGRSEDDYLSSDLQTISKLNEKRRRVQLDLDAGQGTWDRRESGRSSMERDIHPSYHTERYRPSESLYKHHPEQNLDESSSQQNLQYTSHGPTDTPSKRPFTGGYSKTPNASHQTPNFYDALLLSRYRTPLNGSTQKLSHKEPRLSDHRQLQQASFSKHEPHHPSAHSSTSHLQPPPRDGHSGFYLESMKTINELKNFRDTVRTKLAVVGSHTQSSGLLSRPLGKHSILSRERPRTSNKYSRYF